MSFQDIGWSAMNMVVGGNSVVVDSSKSSTQPASPQDHPTSQPHPSVKKSSRKLKHRSHDANNSATSKTRYLSYSKREDKRIYRSSSGSSSTLRRNNKSTANTSPSKSNRTTSTRVDYQRDSKEPCGHQPKTKNRVQPIRPSKQQQYPKTDTSIHGVQPHLDHLKCPVSEKKLMSDIIIASSSTDTTEDDGWADESVSNTEDECLMNPVEKRSQPSNSITTTISTTKRQPSSKSSSPFAKLSSEIVQFQVCLCLCVFMHACACTSVRDFGV
jgi:hypothetical protein